MYRDGATRSSSYYISVCLSAVPQQLKKSCLFAEELMAVRNGNCIIFILYFQIRRIALPVTAVCIPGGTVEQIHYHIYCINKSTDNTQTPHDWIIKPLVNFIAIPDLTKTLRSRYFIPQPCDIPFYHCITELLYLQFLLLVQLVFQLFFLEGCT